MHADAFVNIVTDGALSPAVGESTEDEVDWVM